MQIASSTLSLAAVQSQSRTVEEKSSLGVRDERVQKQRENRVGSHRQQFEDATAEHRARTEKIDEAAEPVMGDPKLRAIILALDKNSDGTETLFAPKDKGIGKKIVLITHTLKIPRLLYRHISDKIQSEKTGILPVSIDPVGIGELMHWER